MRRPEKASQVKALMPFKTFLLNDAKDFLISLAIFRFKRKNSMMILMNEVIVYAIAIPVSPKLYLYVNR